MKRVSGQRLGQQPVDFFLGESGIQPGLLIEGRLQARRGVSLNQCRVMGDWVQLVLFAQPTVPAIAHRHMADFIAKNDVQYGFEFAGKG